MIIEKKVRFTFPKDQMNQPMIYRLVHDYDLLTNIVKAQLTEEGGWLDVLVRGDASQVQNGLDWIGAQGIMVNVLSERKEEK